MNRLISLPRAGGDNRLGGEARDATLLRPGQVTCYSNLKVHLATDNISITFSVQTSNIRFYRPSIGHMMPLSRSWLRKRELKSVGRA